MLLKGLCIEPHNLQFSMGKQLEEQTRSRRVGDQAFSAHEFAECRQVMNE